MRIGANKVLISLLCHVKQIDLTNDLTSFFVTTAALLCQHVIVTSRCKMLLFGAPTKSFRKQIIIKLMFCKTLFIVHVRVKGLLKVILKYEN